MNDFDQIFIEDLKCYATIGIFDWERQTKQPLIINLTLDIPKIKKILTDLKTSNEDVKIKSSLFEFFTTLVKYMDVNSLNMIPTLGGPEFIIGGSKYKKKYETYKKKYLELKKSIN